MKAKIRPSVTIEAVRIKADGTRENLGVIARTKKGNVFTKRKRRVKDNG